jgi:hypothetical protein
MSIDPKKFGLSDSLVNAVNEALKGGQVKLDKNHNGKLDSDDFKKLRGEGAKPDFLDLDKDGNKKEPMKKAANEQTSGDYEKANYKHGMLGPDKKMKNEVADGNKANFKHNMKEDEQIDEVSKGTLSNYIRKASSDAANHAYTAGTGGAGKMRINRDEFHQKTDKRLQGISKAAQKLAKEEVEQVNEKVKTTHENPLVTVHDKDGLHTHANLSTANKIFNTKVKHTDVHAGPVKTKDGHETKNNLTFAISKHHAPAMKEETVDEAATKMVAKPQYDKARPAFGGTNVAADMAARKTEVQRKIAAKQASMQMAKANKRISGTTMKEAKCTCGESKGSKMTCEVCNSENKSLKGGKEPIMMNPPLKEASNLPKAVVTKGHEIAKSLIKHRSKVKEPYAVGMAQAKKSANIKD